MNKRNTTMKWVFKLINMVNYTTWKRPETLKTQVGSYAVNYNGTTKQWLIGWPKLVII